MPKLKAGGRSEGKDETDPLDTALVRLRQAVPRNKHVAGHPHLVPRRLAGEARAQAVPRADRGHHPVAALLGHTTSAVPVAGEEGWGVHRSTG